MKEYFISIFFTFIMLSDLAFAQAGILDNYVEEGVNNNLALKQKELSFEKSLAILKEARGLFFPSIDLESRYSRAEGGRCIEIPVGDLLNPVYATLNQMLSMQGFQPLFPENLENVNVPFLRKEEHDTKIRIVQPIFNLSIYYNYKSKSLQSKAEYFSYEAYKRELKAEIKKAYFDFLSACNALIIYDSARVLLLENLRVSESLFRNSKMSEEVVFRAKAELSEIEQRRFDSQKNEKIARAYFNFLLNKPFDANIIIDTEINIGLLDSVNYDDLIILALKNREELKQLSTIDEALKYGKNTYRGSYAPSVAGVFDYGFQGDKHRFGKEDDYWMVSILFQWNIFRGFQDKAKVEQLDIEKKIIEHKYNDVENAVRLQLKNSIEEFNHSKLIYNSTMAKYNYASKLFFMIKKKYELGVVSQIEFLEARTRYTNSECEKNIALFNVFKKFAELEKCAGFCKATK